MEDNRCIEPGCMLNFEYVCSCCSPPVYTCKTHLLNHMKTPNKDHALKSIFAESSEKTRQAFLSKCDSSIIEDLDKKLREEEKIQRNFRNIIAEDLEEGKPKILKLSKMSESKKEPAFRSDSNTPKTSATSSYQDIASTYQHKTSLFNFVNQSNLLIYSTEIESQASIILDTPEPIGWGTCIAQLPNNKLFCFGNYPPSGITLLIDENYRVQELPSGTVCICSSAIYFDNNIYYFGGWVYKHILTLSSRFDLDRNQWNELTPLPNADYACNSIIFNGSILISGWKNKNILRYSIDSNSFSTIPYEFAKEKRKILLYAERLYLIECNNRAIYESEIGSDTAWRQVANESTIDPWYSQTYCQYNKEEIYIGCISGNKYSYFKFNLNEKRLIKLIKI